MKQNFDIGLALVLEQEGGWADHPSDPGGATMAGITAKTYAAWLGRPVTRARLRAIPMGHIRAIYRAGFWQPAGGDSLPAGVDICVFDVSVNSGPARAIWFLQRALVINANKKLTGATLAAARQMPAATIIERICDDRLAWLRRLRRGRLWTVFGKGWRRRVENVRAASLAMLEKSAEPAPLPAGVERLNLWERLKQWVF